MRKTGRPIEETRCNIAHDRIMTTTNQELSEVKLYTVIEVAKMLGVPTMRVRKLIRNDEMKYMWVGNRMAVPGSAIRGYIANGIANSAEDKKKRDGNPLYIRRNIHRCIEITKRKIEANPKSVVAKRKLDDLYARLSAINKIPDGGNTIGEPIGKTVNDMVVEDDEKQVVL